MTSMLNNMLGASYGNEGVVLCLLASTYVLCLKYMTLIAVLLHATLKLNPLAARPVGFIYRLAYQCMCAIERLCQVNDNVACRCVACITQETPSSKCHRLLIKQGKVQPSSQQSSITRNKHKSSISPFSCTSRVMMKQANLERGPPSYTYLSLLHMHTQTTTVTKPEEC